MSKMLSCRRLPLKLLRHEDAVGFALGVEVLQTNDGAFGDHVRLGSILGSVIVGHDGGVVRRQSIGDELAGITFGGVRRTVASVEQSQSRLGAPVVREVISADGPSVLSDDEPGVVGFGFDLDVGFIRRTGTAWGGAVGIDKSGQIAGRSIDIVDDGLMRDGNVKDAFEGLSGHAGAEAEADGKGEAESHGNHRPSRCFHRSSLCG